jgi:Xaa-Pro dipeptidase
MASDVSYRHVFHQNSDFLYLTGFESPGAFLLIDPKRKRETLFIARLDNHHRVWLGYAPTPEDCKAKYGFSRVLYSDQLPVEIRKARAGYKKAYADATAAKIAKPALTLTNKPAELRDALDCLRAIKLEGELEFMRRANAVSALGHLKVMQGTRPGMREYQVQALFESECLSQGLRHLAYPSIVAAGKNAAVLHYFHNDALLKDGDMLLIDAGAECSGYAADITRTFPVNGRFTSRQRDIYQIVLETQKTCIARSRVGVLSSDLHILSMRLIAEGLSRLGILIGSPESHVEGGAVRLFYPHGLGHMLGLDVHDVLGGKKRQLPNPNKIPVRFVARLEPGFVITMEPGIYFIEALLKDPEIRRKHKGAVNFEKAESFLDFGGVRIEDDIIIQENAPAVNLTTVPKEIDQIEELCALR